VPFRLTAIAIFLAAGSVLQAQAPPPERVRDYDLLHQRIEVSGFNWDSTSFDGAVGTTLVPLKDGLERVVLDMDRQLRVRSVTAGKTALRFERPGDSLVVRLARPARARDTARFTVRYKGAIQQGRGLYFFKEEKGRPHRPKQVYSGGGTDGNPRWIPTYGPPNDKATWELIATVPERLTVVSNGRLVSDRRVGHGLRTTHWSQEKPASTYLISLVAAPLVRVGDRWNDVPVDYYVYPEDSALARPLFGPTPDMMKVYSRLTGVRYPWNKYAQTTVADFIGGMENVSATTLVDWMPDRRAYQDRPWYQHVLIPHELAHQWFGDLVTAENWSNYWLNEGFAQFMPGQYWGEKLGEAAEDDYYFTEYQEYLAKDERRRVPLASYNSNNVYPKGALVLRMLQHQLGKGPFWAAINRYLTAHAGGNATTDDLLTAVREATGQDLTWFWAQWMYGAGYPEFAVSSAWDSAAGAVTLTVRQTQRDTAGGKVPAVFRAPITIRVGMAAGDTARQVVIDRREQEVRIDGVRTEPTMIVFDDENAVVKTLDFRQPTSWLARMLARQPDLWNRAWAIGQLAARPTDSLAGAALTAAARSADHPLTRAQAAVALRKFPSKVAQPTLDAAARDTSSRVRAAAVTAAPFEVASAVWERDSSYEVRAAALATMARLDPVRSRLAILAGLRTSSYRDAIQNAAIAAAIQHPDSELVAELERVAGAQELPTLALGVIAAQGNKQAEAALARLLDDRRPWVREWAKEVAAGETGSD
jgi:aminopeptidase N